MARHGKQKTAYSSSIDVSIDEVQEFYTKVSQKALRYQNRKGSFEENFRQDVNFLLRGMFDGRGLDVSIENEFALKDGKRIDSLIDKVVIEYKSPGLLKANNRAKKNVEAIDGVKSYIERLAIKEKRKKDRYRGFCFDGRFVVLCYFRLEAFVVEDPIPFSKSIARVLLNTILAVKQSHPFTPENLGIEFGPSSKIAKEMIESFHRSITSSKNEKVKDLFIQWQVMFSQASEFVHAKEKLKELINIYDLDIDEGSESEILFCVHTYLGILMKLIAVDVVTLYSEMAPFTRSVSGLSQKGFHAMLRSLEQGEPFYQSGISNFLEADYFSWYLEDSHSYVLNAIRSMFKKFEQFDVGTLSIDPFQTSDLLKNLYQVLIPRQIRHDLGEYYTPDWLADFVLEEMEYGQKPSQMRMLDPSCGTGTFLCLAIRKVRRVLFSQGKSEYDVLKGVLDNVVGMDLNPVAVIAARANYLIGLNTSLAAVRERGEQITLPVYMCDSLLSPKEDDKLLGNQYRMLTSVGEMTFPAKLGENDSFEKFYDALRSSLEADLTEQSFSRILKKKGFNEEVSALEQLYSRLLDLHKKGRNGIWANIIKNSFAPLLIGKFDYVAGNPPWINWEHLPEQYRTNLGFLWEKYGLFDLKGMASIMGGSKRDLSALFTYVCVDHFLKKSGKLGFVIPQTLFKNVQSAEGFRKFTLFGNHHFRVTSADDMVELKPFDAANRTALIFLEKGSQTKYPVPYTIWRKKVKKKFDNSLSLMQVKAMTSMLVCAAKPIDSKNKKSPWLTLPAEVVELASHYLGGSSYKAIEGANSGGLNGFYFVRIKGQRQGDILVENCRERIKVPVPKIEEVIEGKYVYPMLMGREVDCFSASSSQYILMLQDPVTRKGVTSDTLKNESTKLYNIVCREPIKRLLKSRATFNRYYKDTDPVWSMFNVSQDTFAPYKVVWREQTSTFKAAVIGSKNDQYLGKKTVIPDHKLMMIGFNNLSDAHFVCGFLNSFIVKLVVKGYAVDTSISTHVTDFIKIPKFDKNDKIHCFIRNSSIEFHSKGNYDARSYDKALATMLGLSDTTLQHVWDFIE